MKASFNFKNQNFFNYRSIWSHLIQLNHLSELVYAIYNIQCVSIYKSQNSLTARMQFRFVFPITEFSQFTLNGFQQKIGFYFVSEISEKQEHELLLFSGTC